MTTTQQPSAVERAAALLRKAATDLADGVTLPNGMPDWDNEPDAKAAYDEHMAAAEALVQDEKRSLRAQLWSGNAQQSMVLAMQSAYIEWMHGGGSNSAMTWIENTLCGPGLLPDGNEKDAQAFFDRETAVEEARVAALKKEFA